MYHYAAYNPAKMCMKYDAIVKHYYTGVDLTRAYLTQREKAGWQPHSLAPRCSLTLWRKAGASCLSNLFAVHTPFNHFIAKQSENTPANEKRPGVTIPIDARCPTIVVDCGIRLGN